MADRFDNFGGDRVSLVSAQDLAEQADVVFSDGDYLAAIDICDRLIGRFSAGDNPVEQERVAYALLLKGLCLSKLDRAEVAIGLYERLARDYGESTDSKTREHVAWALFNKAGRLKTDGRTGGALANYDELVERFGSASESAIRERVDWGLWSKSRLLDRLGRGGEAEAIYEVLIGRRDEGLDPGLDQVIAWCMQERIERLGRAGDFEAQAVMCDDVVERFGEATDVRVQKHVLWALRYKAIALAALARQLDQIDTYDQISARFGQLSDPDMRFGVAEALRNKAVLLAELGRGEDAAGVYDDALAMLDGASELELRELAIEVLLSKGVTFDSLARRAEAVVIYDSVVSAYLAVSDWGALAGGLGSRIVLALLYKVWNLCELDRSAEAAGARDQLASVLGDIADRPPATEERDLPPEAQLADAFACVFGGDECWRWFANQSEQPPPKLMAKRAVELYRLTEPALTAVTESWSLPAQAASGLLRDIADGYAMLARPWDDADRAALPLPDRAERIHLLQRFGVVEWAAELGHPLHEPLQHTDQRYEPSDHQSAEAVELSAASARTLLRVLHNYDLLRTLCDSTTGRAILKNETFKRIAAHDIAAARKWTARLRVGRTDEPGEAFAALFIAEGFFLASQGAITSSADLFPSHHLLRELILGGELHAFLLDHGAQLPEWLTDPDD